MNKKLFLPLTLILFITSCSKDDSTNSSKSNIPSELVGQWDVIERYSHFHENSIEISPGYKVWTFDKDGNHTYMDYVGNGKDFGVGSGSSFTSYDGKLRIGPENGNGEIYSIEFLTNDELHLKGEHDHLEYKLQKAPVELYGKWEMKESFMYSNDEIIAHRTFNPNDITWEFESTARGYIRNNIEGISMSFNYQLKNNVLTMDVTEGVEYGVQIDSTELVITSNDESARFVKINEDDSNN